MAYESPSKLQKPHFLMYFGMPLKKNDINVLFILIFIHDIGSKFKSHMQLQTILCDYKLFLPGVATLLWPSVGVKPTTWKK